MKFAIGIPPKNMRSAPHPYSEVLLYLLLRPRILRSIQLAKDAPFSSALNYFGMFVMTFHYEWRLKLASVS